MSHSHGANRTIVADGMTIDFDVAIEMDDGNVLRADVFRPIGDGRYPVILSHGAYSKGLAYQDGFPTAWESMIKNFPETARGTTNKYQNWEVADPEKWVPHGYVCLRIDSRGAGRSPGYLDTCGPREMQDLHDCVEWAAAQAWSSGKVGMSGISYYGQNQWYVAKRQPPHLAALFVWEAAADLYRDGVYHGGILCPMIANAVDKQILPVQHGVGERGFRSRVTGEPVSGPETMPREELAGNRAHFLAAVRERPLDDDWYRARSAEWDKTTVPFVSCANWGGQPLHPRGNYAAFMHAASEQKWLEVHGFEHWALYYTDYANDLQKRFFDHFLKGEDNGWDAQPRVQLQIRHPGNRFVPRMENEWPLARTRWTKYYLDPASRSLTLEQPDVNTTVDYSAMGEGVTFMTPPLAADLEITGPAAAKLFLSSSTQDADVFLVVRAFDEANKEVLFRGALDPRTPVAQGWLRVSHRKLDPVRSTPYQPYHTHDEVQPLVPGQPVDLDIEIHPTCIVLPAGYRLALTILGRDFEHDEEPAILSNIKNPMKGCGPFLHDDPTDRPAEVFGGQYRLHFGDAGYPYVLLPVIPSSE